jgi:hypothetical protein
MAFKTTTHKLVARICAYCQEKHYPDPGQVRTTKLVYLVECGFYGWERKRLTDLDWIFWHYGPWSSTLDKILKEDFKIPPEEEPEAGKFIPVHWQPPMFEKPILKFDNITAESVVLTVLDRFAGMPYNELLDYVYFETAPMRVSVKGQALDFSGIHKPTYFIDPASFLSLKVFNDLKEKFKQLKIHKVAESKKSGEIDADLAQLLEAIDVESPFSLPEGEVLLDSGEVREIFRD